jgi:succinate dehydrogenase hydrophobic anchor subunit
MHHEDTTLWWLQVVTGFALLFLASVHLYQMIMHPAAIGRISTQIAFLRRKMIGVGWN